MPTTHHESLPIFCHHESVLDDCRREVADDEWIEQNRSRICDAFRESGGRDWVSQLVAHWGLDKLPPAELSETLGICFSQAWRLQNDFSASIGVIGQWAVRHGHPLPAPRHERWSVEGLVGALQVTHWLGNTTTTRLNRKALPAKVPEHEIHLLVVLFSGGALFREWHSLTRRFELNLYQAAEDERFLTFLRDVSTAYLRLTQNLPSAKRRYPIYFPNGQFSEESRWQLCRDINSLWQKVHIDGRRTWYAVDGLTPWLLGLVSENDDEAA